MSEVRFQNLLARAIALGCFFTTILVVNDSVTDPVNAPKFLILGITAILLLTFGIYGMYQKKILIQIPFIVIFVIFNLAMLNATVQSDIPLSQNLYGAYGRNSGFLTYFFLSVMALCASSLTRRSDFLLILKSLFYSGVVNVLYCGWVLIFGDFISWSNPYGNILGTFGNPNFIGSFLGIFAISYFAYLFSIGLNIRYKIVGSVIILISAVEIYLSNAIQGRVVLAFGLTFTALFLIKLRFSKIWFISATGLSIILGILSLLGALQKGPFAEIIYKTSVSLRGQYWYAGWKMGAENPFSGVGMDSIGEWYRRTRGERSIELPGLNTVVNASHNVPIDMFAFGGWLLLVSYLAIVVLASISAIRILLRRENPDFLFIALLVAWMGYQLQSIISINQIGLAIWGWVLSGVLIGYEKSKQTLESTKTKPLSKNLKSPKSIDDPIIPILAGIALTLGFILASPPLLSDIKWRDAQRQKSVEKIIESMQVTYFNPPNMMKYLTNIHALEENGFHELSYDYALKALTYNPHVFELWKTFYFLKNVSPQEKEEAKLNMVRLDPRNPDVTALK